MRYEALSGFYFTSIFPVCVVYGQMRTFCFRPILPVLIAFGSFWPVLRAESAAAIAQSPETVTSEARVESEEARRARGRALISGASVRLKENNVVDAIKLFRAGLELCPEDRDARFELATLWLSARRYSTGREVFLRQLDFGYPGRDYLMKVLDYMTLAEDSVAISALCARALALHDPAMHPTMDRGWLQGRWARALVAAEDWLALERMLAENGAELPEAERRELRLFVLLGTGRIDEARVWIGEWRAEAGPTPQVLRLQARVCREAGDLDGMAEALEEVIRAQPTDPRARAFAVVQHLLTGSEEEAGRQLDTYLLYYGATTDQLLLLAGPLGEIGREQELDRVLAAATEQGLADSRFLLLRLQLLLERRRWDDAAAVLNTLRPLMESGSVPLARRLALTESLLRAVREPEEVAQAGFLARLERLSREPALYRAYAEALLAGGREETARRVVASGLAMYPDNVALRLLGEQRGVAVPAATPASTAVPGTPVGESR